MFAGQQMVAKVKRLSLSLALALTACDRSPHEFARSVSGLPIPSGAHVLSFVDKPSGLVGEDLFARAEFELSPAEFGPLITQARELGYHSLDTSKERPADAVNQFGVSQKGLAEATAELQPEGKGFFRYVRDGVASYSLVVLDAARHRVVVQVVIL